ncbi:YDG/SRA domain-containing protein [Streptomyces sp. ACT015]|uniref:YDG/SRA domain-containing protein n=1 Tax=Streptomyces sp. ACT015 TaxID=3134807 RepID=UPI003D16D49E
MPSGDASEARQYLRRIKSLHADLPPENQNVNQSLILLWAIGRASKLQDRLPSWSDAESSLQGILSRHGVSENGSAENPFGTLQGCDFWTSGTQQSELESSNSIGGLEDRLYDLLARDKDFREEATYTILRQHFPEYDWQDILIDVGLQDGAFDGFGHPPCVPVGAHFRNRKALAAANVHRPGQAGIWGRRSEDAKSIVVSGGYPDDEDFGEEIIYTGQGGQTDGRHTHDQELIRGNAALMNSRTSGRPVRVIRGAGEHSPHAPQSGLRYDGLYRVEDGWSQRGVSNFLVWRFRLTAIREVRESHVLTRPIDQGSSTAPPTGNQNPGRRRAETQRIVRSTATANWVKRLHDHECQVCGLRIATPTGAYSEAAHIRPLGNPHLGPDVPSNILCLCPNHHVAFDFGMLKIESDLTVVDRATDQRSQLRVHPEHIIDLAHLQYHREHHA